MQAARRSSLFAVRSPSVHDMRYACIKTASAGVAQVDVQLSSGRCAYDTKYRPQSLRSKGHASRRVSQSFVCRVLSPCCNDQQGLRSGPRLSLWLWACAAVRRQPEPLENAVGPRSPPSVATKCPFVGRCAFKALTWAVAGREPAGNGLAALCRTLLRVESAGEPCLSRDKRFQRIWRSRLRQESLARRNVPLLLTSTSARPTMLRTLFRGFFRGKSAAAPAASAPTTPVPAASSAPDTLRAAATPSTAREGPVTAADPTLKASAPTPPSTDKPAVRSPTDPAAEYQRRLEERFGGQDASALGTLVNGQPEGLAPHVKRNMFRVI
ncbi:hypothetical protein DMC30DRAFT_77267 [Rhodotorula diobovata]|uniref:Uncharacterized protein n=1 Tax=Rhodotorula diobovata TaxID=5288 RepID=A0A5C5G294_9BASI|nr:hypothetical protein DMC30DRAFT_77267 [Rhodotorula diobovata]